MNSKGRAMQVALAILAMRGPPRAIEFRRPELPELLFCQHGPSIRHFAVAEKAFPLCSRQGEKVVR
jgi:hypothetical protein